jgi:hypothetical protein
LTVSSKLAKLNKLVTGKFTWPLVFLLLTFTIRLCLNHT